jgi:hypothetical protein
VQAITAGTIVDSCQLGSGIRAGKITLKILGGFFWVAVEKMWFWSEGVVWVVLNLLVNVIRK